MAVYIEFVIPGPPISNQQNTPAGKWNLKTWYGVITGLVGPLWGTKAVLTGELKAVVINFFAGNKPSVDVDNMSIRRPAGPHHRLRAGNKPSVDVDNMSKPIFDAMQKVVYKNDRQIRQAEIAHVRIDAAFTITGVSKVLLDAIHAGSQFVYVRVEDPVAPFPLPK